MKSKIFLLLVLLSLALAATLPATNLLAASSNTKVGVSFSILPFQMLSIAGGASGNSAVSSVHVPQPQIADLNRGYIDQRNAVRLSLRSNVPWRVKVRTSNRDMGTSFDGSYVKPVSDFQLRAAGSPYLTIDDTDQVLLRGNFGKYDFDIDYRTLFDKGAFRSGNYQIDIVYTIVSR